MTKRTDGKQRRQQLLDAATEVFACKGYRQATISEICQAADSNIASINYYFGSKEKLYAAVWKSCFNKAMKIYPPDGGLGPDAPPKKRLKAVISSILNKILDTGTLGYGGQILLMELTNPTGALESVKKEVVEPLHKNMLQLMRELLGPEATDRQLEFCAMSTLHQCLGLGFFRSDNHPPVFKISPDSELVEPLSEHIYQFSIAGISAIRSQIEAK